jgi:hypothetical protein
MSDCPLLPTINIPQSRTDIVSSDSGARGTSPSTSPVTVVVRIESQCRCSHYFSLVPLLWLRVVGVWLHWVGGDGLGLLLRGCHHGRIRCFDDIVVEVGDCLEHAGVAKVLCARRESRLTRCGLGSLLGRASRGVGRILSRRCRWKRRCQSVGRIRKVRFIELNLGDTNAVSVDLTTEHGTISKLVVVWLCWTLTSIVGEGPFEVVWVDVFVGMRDWHNWVCGRLRGRLRLLMIQCNGTQES